MYPVIANGIRTGDPRGFNKGRSSKFRVRKTPEEGRRTYRLKRLETTIKMKTIVRKPLMIKIIQLCLRNLDNKHLKKAGGHIDRNVVEITINMKTIVLKPLMIKIIKLRLRNFYNYLYLLRKINYCLFINSILQKMNKYFMNLSRKNLNEPVDQTNIY